MKNILILIVGMSLLLGVSCSRVTPNLHKGDNVIYITDIKLDSLVISADSTSIRGGFLLMDTSLLFYDMLYCKIFPYSIFDGKPGIPYGNRGNGPNEMIGVVSASVISDSAIWIFDSSNGVYEFIPSKGTIDYLTRLDLHWDNVKKNDYDSPSVYNLMEVTSYGISAKDLGNNQVIIPVSLIDRFLSGVSEERYDKGHIFGLLDKNTLKVSEVFGSMPEYYKENPLPQFEFFDFAYNDKDSIIYVNHTPDSMIYCYKYPDSLLYTMGFEPEGLHRDFTKGYDYKFEDFKKEIRKASTNTGLFYDKVDDILFRTSITDYESGNAVLQIYKDTDLIGEVKVPPYFKMLGRVDNKYYAVRFTPVEADDENVYFVLYSFPVSDIVK